MSEAVVAVENVSFRRDGAMILSDVSWRIDRGEHWALIGANGSGKTTLLKIVTGYEWPTAGRVAVLGYEYGSHPLADVRRHIGWVSQSLGQRIPGADTARDVALSGLDATLGLYRAYNADERAAADEALDLLGVARLAGRAFGCLSQGEQQRVAIARALIARPALLILDEPCGGLDPAAREAFLGDLERFAKRPEAPSLLLVTHHIEEIGPSVTRVCVLEGGKVLMEGAKEAALRSAVLSRAFGCAVEAERIGERYALRVAPHW